MSRSDRGQEMGVLQLADEAFHILRRDAVSTLGRYYLGSLPFILALLFFWAEMSRGALADQYLLQSSMMLAVLFIWMKCWQAVFARRLYQHLSLTPDPGWTLARALNLVALQALLQPTGLVLLPLSFLLLLPFAWVYGFYQNLSLQADGQTSELGSVVRRSWRLAGLWPQQNHWLIWLLSPWLLMSGGLLLLLAVPFLRLVVPEGGGALGVILALLVLLALIGLSPLAVILALNLAAALFMLPYLLKSLLGLDTWFTLSGMHLLNSSFFAVTICLTYLVLDPMVKAAYVIRCFQGESLKSGADLQAALRRIRRGNNWVVCFWILGGLCLAEGRAAGHVRSQTMAEIHPTKKLSVSVPQLDRAITDVMHQSEYRWRLPRKSTLPDQESEVVSDLGIVGWLKERSRGLGVWWKQLK